MCELLGMSAKHATDVNQSLEVFQPRGGDTGPHADGWGIAYFDGRAAALFKECMPAASSRCFATLAERSVRSTQVIAHIRRANPPQFGRSWANTHPFERELGGRSWVFAHNGKLRGIHEDPRFKTKHFQPLGDTDSERAFCHLLDVIRTVGTTIETWTPEALLTALREPTAQLASLGEFNYLLGNGQLLVVHGHSRLSMLQRTCSEDGCAQRVTLVATQPLTDEAWQPLAPGSFVVLQDGVAVNARLGIPA